MIGKPSVNPADSGMEGLLEVFKRAAFLQLRVCFPAIVEHFNAAANRVSVLPAVSAQNTAGEAVNLPLLSDVPVCTAGGGGFAATFPLQKGDTGWLVFADRDISLFKEARAVSPANTNRLHALGDAVFFPDVMQTVPAQEGKAVWRTLDGAVKVEMSAQDISITGNVSLNGNVSVSGGLTATGTITADVDVVAGGISLKNHIHGGVQGGSGATGPAQ